MAKRKTASLITALRWVRDNIHHKFAWLGTDEVKPEDWKFVDIVGNSGKITMTKATAAAFGDLTQASEDYNKSGRLYELNDAGRALLAEVDAMVAAAKLAGAEDERASHEPKE